MAWFNPFKKSFTQQEQTLFRFLSKTRIFEGMSNEELSGLLPHLFLRTYKQNEVVYFREDPGAALYLVKSGSVSASLDIDGQLETLTHIKPFGFFGQEALMPIQKRLCNMVVDSEEAELYVIPQVNLLEYADRSRRFKAKLYHNQSKVNAEFMTKLFKSYRQEFGLFELKQAFLYRSE